MDKYQRVEKARPQVPIMENEFRIATQGMPRNYITYALILFREKGASEVFLKAMGKAISKAVTVVEIIKRRIPNLHQNTLISSTPIPYMWEPVEEALLPLETIRHVSMITITLSTRQLDTSSTGYQPPLPADRVRPPPEYEYEGKDFRVVLGKCFAHRRGTGRGGNTASNFGMGGGNLPTQAQGHGRRRSSGNEKYGNGSFNNNGMGTMDVGTRGRGGNGRNRFGYDGNYSDNGFRRGQGRGQGRTGGSDQDEWEVISRRRGRVRGRGMGRLNESFAREALVG